MIVGIYAEGAWIQNERMPISLDVPFLRMSLKLDSASDFLRPSTKIGGSLTNDLV